MPPISEKTQHLFNELRALNLPGDQYAIFGSGPLGVRGLRDITDVDIIVTPELFAKLAVETPAIDHAPGVRRIQRGNIEILDAWSPSVGPIPDLIADAEAIDGLSFVRLDKVLAWKRLANRPKDALDIARIEGYLAGGHPTTALRMEEFLPQLRRHIAERPGEVLYISIGEGDLTASWLSRLHVDTDAPALTRVVVLRLREETIASMETRGDLVKGFGRRVRHNLDTIADLLGARGVELEIRESARLPAFHGYLYGDHFFRGPWSRGGPHHHVRTTVEHLQRSTHPHAFAEALHVFTDPVNAPIAPQLTIGVLVPLEEEWNQLREVFPIIGHAPGDGTFYYTLDSGLPYVQMVGTFLEQMGPLPAAITATQLIERYQPDLIVVVGIAGSLDRDVELGDVAIASVVNQYQATSKAEQDGEAFRMSYSGESFRADRSLIKAVVHFSQNDLYKRWRTAVRKDQTELDLPERAPPTDHVGRLASGDTVGSARAFVQELRKIDRKFLALEMEAAGVAAAAAEREQPVKWLALRGISDPSDETKQGLDTTHKGAWRRYAMRSAARYLAALLTWDEFRKKARRS